MLLHAQFRNRFACVHIFPGFQQLAPPLPYYMSLLTHLITGVLLFASPDYGVIKTKAVITIITDPLFDIAGVDPLQIISACAIEVIGTGAAKTDC